MSENEEFKMRFENIEQALKYIADSQAKSEWLRKQDEQKARESAERIAALDERVRVSEERLKKRFDYLAKLTGIAFEQMNDYGEQMEKASKSLKHK